MPNPAWGVAWAAWLRRVFLTDALTRMTIRGALYIGFSLIFVLWLVSGVDLVGLLIDANERAVAVNGRLTQAEDAVTTIRTQVLLSSITLRDALLDTPSNVAFYRSQLQDRRKAVEQALEEYEPVADSLGEREAIDNLRSELQNYWKLRLAVVEWDATRRSAELEGFIRGASMPSRDEVLRISAGVQALHRASFVRKQDEVAGIYAAMRRRIWVTTCVALVLSVGVAMLVTAYVGLLERRIQRQRTRDLQKTRDLRRLSAKLVHAQEEERRVIARELHDEVGQALTAIKLELSVAERTLDRQVGTNEALNGVRAISDRALQSVRDLSHLLHPALLDDIGLSAALDLQLQSFSKRSGIRTELLQIGMEHRLAPDVELCLYRVAQEGLTNVARHANASSCRVHLRRVPDSVELAVEDDGRGFVPPAADGNLMHGGLGLLGIRERVTGLNGSIRLDSVPGRGTRLTVVVPIALGAGSPEPEAPEAPVSSPQEEYS